MHHGFERKSLQMAAMLMAEAMGTHEATAYIQAPDVPACIEWPLPNGQVIRVVADPQTGLAAYLKKGHEHEPGRNARRCPAGQI